MDQSLPHDGQAELLSIQALGAALPNVIFACSPDGQTEYVNHAWSEFTGLSEQEHLGLNWAKLLHPEDRERVLALWSAAVCDCVIFEEDYRFKGKDDNYRWFKCRAVPFKDEDGKIIKWFGSLTDIQVEKMQQIEAEESRSKLEAEIKARKRLQQFREDVIAHLSHDVRNNLLGQKRVIEHLINILDDDHARDIIAALLQSNASSLEIIAKLVDVDKYVFVKQSVLQKSLQLAVLIDACMSEIAGLASAAGIKMEKEIEDPLLEVNGDEELLKRLLLNLLHNALQFTPQGGSVKVSLEAVGSQARLSVSDTGIGIPEDERNDLFNRFWKGDRPKQYTIGKGFGLYLCQQIAETHKGSIACRETSERGTIFDVFLPRCH